MRISFSRPARRTAALVFAIIFILWGIAGWYPAAAAKGPFADFHGRWSGSGTIRQAGKRPERMRCSANYRLLDSSGHDVELKLACDSDTYKFDLSGQFQADDSNHITGQFAESTRGIGGTVNGYVRGSHLQIHVESGGFSAAVSMSTHSRQQSVSIDAQGGGESVKASISLHRH